MTTELEQHLLGGPGLDGYTYNADTYCIDCGKDIIREQHKIGGELPSPMFFSEFDYQPSCGKCGELLQVSIIEQGE